MISRFPQVALSASSTHNSQTLSPFHFKPGGFLLLLAMASRRDSLRAHKRLRALRQKDAGTLCSVVCSPAIRSDPLQEISLKASRKKDHHESEKTKNHHKFEGVNAFQHFKRATRIESLSEDLPQLKRHVHIHSGALIRS